MQSFCEGHFADPPKSQLEQWHPWRAPIGQWGPGFASTDYVAHYRVIGHCVDVMAAYGVSQIMVFSTTHPPQPHHPVPPQPSIINTDGTKKWQKVP